MYSSKTLALYEFDELEDIQERYHVDLHGDLEEKGFTRAEIPKAFKELFEPARYKIYWGGRGGAKSWNIARALLILGAHTPLKVLCTREYQNSIADSVHALLAFQIKLMNLGHVYTVNKNEIIGKNGTLFIFKGIARSVQEVKSTEGVDICWVEEANSATETSWDTIIPTIRKEGAEIWASFNPRFKHEAAYRRFIVDKEPEFIDDDRWAVVKKVGMEDNPFFTGVLQQESDNLKEKDYAKWLHVYGGELLEIAEGAIFGVQYLAAKRQGRIMPIPLADGAEVFTFWDLGKNDQTAIWWMQNIGPQYRFIDFYQARQREISHYIDIIKGQCEDVSAELNERRRGYNYGMHYMPHDVAHDILGMERNRQQQFEDGGVKPIEVVPRTPSKEEAIQAGRDAFAECYFDEHYCEDGLDMLKSYRYDYDEKNDTFRKHPHHDFASNGADAYLQFAQAFNPYSGWGGIKRQEKTMSKRRRSKVKLVRRGNNYGLG